MEIGSASADIQKYSIGDSPHPHQMQGILMSTTQLVACNPLRNELILCSFFFDELLRNNVKKDETQIFKGKEVMTVFFISR